MLRFKSTVILRKTTISYNPVDSNREYRGNGKKKKKKTIIVLLWICQRLILLWRELSYCLPMVKCYLGAKSGFP
eukprot:SAG11_NODE_26_length_23420_cov_40.459886_21_plen_74_part_00